MEELIKASVEREPKACNALIRFPGTDFVSRDTKVISLSPDCCRLPVEQDNEAQIAVEAVSSQSCEVFPDGGVRTGVRLRYNFFYSVL